MKYVNDLVQVYTDLAEISKAPVYDNLEKTMKSDMKYVVKNFIEKYIHGVGCTYNNIAAYEFVKYHDVKSKYYKDSDILRRTYQNIRINAIRLNMSYLRSMDDIIFNIKSLLSKYFENDELIKFISGVVHKDEDMYEYGDMYEAYYVNLLIFADPDYLDMWETGTLGDIKDINTDLYTNYDIFRYHSKCLMRLHDNLMMKYFYKYEYICKRKLHEISIKKFPTMTYGSGNKSEDYYVFNFYYSMEIEYITDAKYYVDDLKNHIYNIFKLKW